ncbi:unnamed protein product, partial [marine sediment metagenome]
LRLEGDLMEALGFELGAGSIIRVGVLDTNETDKADGHNQFSSDAKAWASKNKFPKRRYIPEDNQSFTKNIVAGVNGILNEFRLSPEDQARERRRREVASSEVTEEATEITLEEILGEEDLFEFSEAE